MNTRYAATQILLEVIQRGQSLTNALEGSAQALSPEPTKDKAFIQALCYGVLRHYFELEALLACLLNKPFRDKELEIHILALVGLFQLKYMRVKEHAAVAETVAAAKRYPWAKAVLNAIFRRYLREKSTLDHDARIDIQNHPSWLLKKIQEDWPAEAEQIIAHNNQAPPMVLRVNTKACSRNDYLNLLAQAGIEAQVTAEVDTGIELKQACPIEKLPQFSAGLVSVQDAAAQLATELLDLRPGQRVLDLCAAPGGKTCAILERDQSLQYLLAVDSDANRLQRLTENLKRLHLDAAIIVGDAADPSSWWDGQAFERILLDSPCSATGVIRRHPDIKLLRRAEDIDALVKLQQQILTQAWSLLAPQGILLYATCSILKQENEQQIEQFLSQHRDAEALPIQATWGLERLQGRQILTGMHAMDGFYYARLRKTG